MSQAPPAGQANMREALPAGQANMREALHAEWTKLRTAPGTIWLLLALIALTVALGTAVAAAVTCPSGGCNQDPTKLSLTGIGLGQAAIAILAVLAVSGEYHTGMIRITLTAMPRRPSVLAAKATILTGMTLGAGTLAVAGCLLAGRLLLPPTASPPPTATRPCR
jgi:ABC-2 type transport system permease protein